MDGLLGEQEFWEAVLEGCEAAGYEDRVEKSAAYFGIGAFGPIVLLTSKERHLRSDVREGHVPSPEHPVDATLRDIRRSFTISGMMGGNTRVVDDVLDGDGCEPLDHEYRDEFLSHYIQAVATGRTDMPDFGHDVVPAAYHAGATLNTLLSGDGDAKWDVVDYLMDMRDRVATEDKSTEDGYLDYISVAGGDHGALNVAAMSVLPTFDPDHRDYEFARDFAYGVQFADDWFDDDLGLERDEMVGVYEDIIRERTHHEGVIPTVIGALARLSPETYRPFIQVGGLREKIRSYRSSP
ncbi:MAG: hypothetical protein SVW77_04180 [Candidatus Nanohaloarchaea archaeon]|nr:hypothetical protein [Candidatus Nanohaloarchaea archaeon]